MPRAIRALPMIATMSLAIAAFNAVPAAASSTQGTIFEDNTELLAHPGPTLATLRELGVTQIRLSVTWGTIAPRARSHHKPKQFHADNPSSYPASGWAPYDHVVEFAQTDGIAVGMMLTGPGPAWADAPGEPRGATPGIWKPSPREFKAFVKAVGKRYSGNFKDHGTSIPRVSFWSIWNEPNYGVDLAPQSDSTDTVELGAAWYRKLVDAGWSALHATHHGGDTMLIGETAPRGLDHPIGNFSGTKPLRFLRALYCVDSHYHQLRGSAASARGCPTSASGSRRFRGAHPGLFKASGFADHPYAQGVAPNVPTYACGKNVCSGKSDPDYADFPKIPRLEHTLDHLNRVYGSHTHFPVYNTEYGYWTKPPDPHATISQKTAAYYINWAEYLSWKQGRLRSYDQYKLVDSPHGNFASGLELVNHKHKATYNAFRMPLYLPHTKGHNLEVWGCLRPAHFAELDTHKTQSVKIQFRRGKHGPWKTVKTVAIHNKAGYFDVHVAFPGAGGVRLQWAYPSGQTIHSRTVTITAH